MGKGEHAFSYCAVCRLNHGQGRGHRYSKGHRNALQNVLRKMQAKIQSVRAFFQKPQGATPLVGRFWCWFCEEDVVDHRDGLYPGSYALEHLSSAGHVANVKKFWCEHGPDPNIRQEYYFSKKEVANWEASLDAATSGDNEASGVDGRTGATNIHSSAGSSGAYPDLSVPPLLNVLKDQKLQVSRQNGAAGHQPLQQSVSVFGENLTAITLQPLLPGEGNVHSGAPPPWLSNLASNGNEGDSSRELSKRKERKMQRLAKRVGAAWAEKRRAELERENPRKHNSSDWLPSFGRVWQSGSRRDSRKEFEAETVHKKKTKSEPPPAQPYIGKRKRMQMDLEQANETQ